VSFSPALPMSYAHETSLGRPSCPWRGEAAIASESTRYSRQVLRITAGDVTPVSTPSRQRSLWTRHEEGAADGKQSAAEKEPSRRRLTRLQTLCGTMS
jgi:hypothetical protein